MVLYLPRSTPPEPTGAISDIPQWDTIPIYPRYWSATKTSRVGQDVEVKNPAETINVSGVVLVTTRMLTPSSSSYQHRVHMPLRPKYPSTYPSLQIRLY